MKPIYINIIFYFLSINSYIIHNTIYKPINNKKINMYYDETRNYDNPITILPNRQTQLIIDNWLNATIALKNYNTNVSPEDLIDTNISNDLYEFKVFLSINKNSINNVYFSWIPESHKENKQVVYLIAGKFLNSELHIYRIAQNPYAANLLNINSKDLLLDLHNYYKDNTAIKYLKFDELHKYDKRYLWSWSI
jgi:hypothetical protein